MNWKTTVAGIAGALLINVVPLLQGTWDWKELVTGIAIAILGYLAKDFDTTGIGIDATKKTT